MQYIMLMMSICYVLVKGREGQSVIIVKVAWWVNNLNYHILIVAVSLPVNGVW